MPLPLRSLASLLLLGMLQAALGNQTGPPAEKPPLGWASVSIHVSDPDRQGGNYSNEQANGLNVQGLSLSEFISQGYSFSVMPFREDEITGLPDWAKTTRYDIVARVDPEDASAFKKLSNLSMGEAIAAYSARRPTGEMLMVQSLLTERFHLKVHWDSKERTVYALSVAKSGIRMKSAVDPEHGEMTFSRGHLSGKGVPLSFLASLLAQPAERTVVDQTGVAGAYDFDLQFDPRDGAASTESNAPEFFTALQEQLGLKLQTARVAVPLLVVDHIDPPTAN